MWIAQPERGLRTAWRTLLAEDVGNVVCTESAGCRGFLNGSGHVLRAVLPDQFQEFRDLPGERTVRIRHVAEVRLHKSSRTQAIQRIEQPLLRLGTARRRPLLGEDLFETIGAESLAAPPRPRITDDLLNAIIDGDGTGIGLDRQPPANVAVWHTIAIGIKPKSEILVNEGFAGVAVVVRDDGQRPQGLRLETIERPLARLAVHALISDFGEPLPRLAINIMQIGELTQRPEVLAQVSNGAFHFSFFPTAGGIAGVREEAIFAGEAKESGEKTDEASVVFGNGGGQIIVGDLTRNATQRSKCVNMTTGEGFETLTMREFDIEHAAVRIDEGKSIELAGVP